MNTLLYSSINEDGNSERTALSITTEDTILTITGSGARALDLLVDNPKKIISVDSNPLQSYLLELKLGAITALTYEEFLSFLGLTSVREDVLSLYRKVRPFQPFPLGLFLGVNKIFLS